ncbi:MAG TPA: hypothetical protein PKM65_13590 [Spirochaetota bacterium]|nr:hypothetical protein [Spirochaetota bacterium]HNT11098.1 hypothetical protein [Spirochaetota bacterium]
MMKRKSLFFSAVLLLSAIVGVMSVTDAFAVVRKQNQRTMEKLSLNVVPAKDVTLFLKGANRYEHWNRADTEWNKGENAYKNQAGGTVEWEYEVGGSYNLKLSDDFSLGLGAYWYQEVYPSDQYSGPASDKLGNKAGDPPYLDSINFDIAPKYKLGDASIYGRVRFVNEVFWGNTEVWTKRSYATSAVNDLRGKRVGYDKSEEYGWAMTTRILLGADYKVTKKFTVFGDFEVRYGTIEDNETKFVPGLDEKVIRTGRGAGYNPKGPDGNSDTDPDVSTGIAHGKYFKTHGLWRYTWQVGMKLQLTDALGMTLSYFQETNLNPYHNPNDPVVQNKKTGAISDYRYTWNGVPNTQQIVGQNNYLYLELAYKLDLTK